MSIQAISCHFPKPSSFDIDLTPVICDKNMPEVEVQPPALTWHKAYQVAIVVFYYLLFPITYPLKLLIEYVEPFKILTEVVARSMIFATDLLNPKFGSIGAFFLNSIGYHSTIDQARMDETKRRFENIGAEFVEVSSADGQTFEMMRITQEAFKTKVRENGGNFEIRDNGEFLVGINENFKQDLKKLGWPEVDGLIQFRKGLISEADSSNGVIMRIHPYSHLSFFEKKYIINHLALGKDFVTYDSRGHREGDHLCSEEGIYLDAQAAYARVRNWGYEDHDIWVTAKCGGAPAILFLKEKFSADFNMVLENTFLNYGITTRQNMPLAHMIGWDMLKCFSAKDQETIEAAQEDHADVQKYCDVFDNASKLRRIEAANPERIWKNKVVVISAERDLSVEPEAGSALASLSSRVSETTYHLIHRLPSDQVDGHRDEALITDAELFKVYSHIVTDKKQIVELNCNR